MINDYLLKFFNQFILNKIKARKTIMFIKLIMR